MTFKSGEPSPNPNGRPRGSGQRQKLFNSLVGPHKDALFAKSISMALEGNEAMLRLLLERMLPAKPIDNQIEYQLPREIKNTQSIVEATASVIEKVSNGDLTPEEGKALITLIEAQRKNIETDSLQSRIVEIEKTLTQRNQKGERK